MNLLIKYRRRKFFLKIFFLCAIILVTFIIYHTLKIQQDYKTEQIQQNPTINKIEARSDSSEDYQLLLHGSNLKGVSKDLKPYSVKSAKASKISEGIFDLKQIDINYTIDSNQLSIIAKNGFIDNIKNSITLKDNVKISFSDLILNTEEININLLTKDLYSNSHVEMLFRNTKIDADSLATDNNDTLILRGHVHTKIDLSDF